MAIHKIKIFTGRDSEYLAKKIAASFGTTLGQSEVLRFSDGEFQPCYNESIRGCTVFIIQSTFPPSDNLMELLMMIDAARRASAHQVVAVMPYFGWARQDRKDRPRVPIGAKLVANMLMAAGVDRVMTMDLHADQIQGFFDVPVDALYASGIFVPYIKSLNIEDLSIAAPDMGGAKRANTYSKLLGTPIIISHKERAKANVVGKMTAIGDVEGRNVLIVGDMIAPAGTGCMAAALLALGDGGGALEHIDRIVGAAPLPSRDAALHLLKARALWLTGRADEAKNAVNAWIAAGGGRQ